MTEMMNGIRVVELATFGFVPTAAVVLGSWGADVIKVEHPVQGDPTRGLSSSGIRPGDGVHFLWEVFNRGKRSLGLDVAQPSGQEVLHSLLDTADVLLTNFLGPARERLGLDDASVRSRHPALVYGRGTGQGTKGPEADDGGFDGMSYWYRTGLGMAARPPGESFPVGLPVPAFGDIQTGTHLAGGVAAALFARERTGQGALVDTSLLLGGLWANQAALAGVHVLGTDLLPRHDRHHPQNPIHNQYVTGDGRVLTLSMLQADRYWPEFCIAIGHAELAEDPRFRTATDRTANLDRCVALLAEIFAGHTLEHWSDALSRQEGPWGVVRTTGEALTDGQAADNNYIRWVDYSAGAQLPIVASPVQFDDIMPRNGRRAPTLGEHTDELLLEMGLSWDEIIEMKLQGLVT